MVVVVAGWWLGWGWGVEAMLGTSGGHPDGFNPLQKLGQTNDLLNGGF